MSRKTYARGFCKAASSMGVNPKELAKFVKNAFSLDELKKSISDAWNNLDPEYKPLVGSGVGLLGGAGLGALAGGLTGLGAGRGALAGAGIGGVGGALYGSNAATRQQKAIQEYIWKSKNDTLNSIYDNLTKTEKSLAEQIAGRKSDQEANKSNVQKLNAQISDLNNKLQNATSQAQILRIIKDDLKDYPKLSPEEQKKVYQEVQDNLKRVQSQLSGIHAYHLQNALRRNASPEQVKAYEQKEIERRSKQKELNKMIEEIARINEQDRIKQLKEKTKNAPTFNFPNR